MHQDDSTGTGCEGNQGCSVNDIDNKELRKDNAVFLAAGSVRHSRWVNLTSAPELFAQVQSEVDLLVDTLAETHSK